MQISLSVQKANPKRPISSSSLGERRIIRIGKSVMFLSFTHFGKQWSVMTARHFNPASRKS